MPRRARLHFENCIYHVYNRGNNKEQVFFEENDYNKFLNLLFEIANELNIIVYFYSLIPNHFHITLRTLYDNISEFLHRINQRYTQYINWKYKRVGSIFQKRTKTIIVYEEHYIVNLFFYINLNSQKHKLTEDPFNYKWSSLKYYINPEMIPFKYNILKKGILEFYKINDIVTPDNVINLIKEKISNIDILELPKVIYSCFYGDEDLVRQKLTKIDRRVGKNGENKKRRFSDKEKDIIDKRKIEDEDILKEYIINNKFIGRYKLKHVLIYLDKVINSKRNVELSRKYNTSISNITKILTNFNEKLLNDVQLNKIVSTLINNLQ